MLLSVEHVTKSYRSRRTAPVVANQDISFSVDEGEVFGLFGHNGAGKTTLVNQIVGTAVPDSGTVTVDGHDATAKPDVARMVTSLQPQAQVPLSGLTPRQAVEILGRLRGGASDDVTARAESLFAALDITEWADTVGQRLSGGVRRLTGFCLAAVVPGRVVVLDEPTNDVDPVRRRLLWRQVRALAEEGHAVLLVSHNVSEAERAVDRLVILDQGRVLASGTVAELKSGVSGELRVELVLAEGNGAPEAADPPVMPGFVTDAHRDGRRMLAHIEPDSIDAAASWARELSTAGEIEEFSIRPATLEDVYIALADGEATSAPAGTASTKGAGDAE